MAHGDGDLQRVGELLEPYLPQTAAGAVTPAAVGQDQQRIRQRVASPTLLLPPQTDTLDGKIRGVVADAHIHKPTVEGLSLIHISEPTRLGMISYAVFCLKKKK